MRRVCIWFTLIGLLFLMPGKARAEEIDGEPQIYMNVLEPGTRSASVALGQEHTWYIRCLFPETIGETGECTVLQTLSPGLTYIPGSVEVSFWKEEEIIPFAMEEAYMFTAGTVFVEGGIADRISISLTEYGSSCLSAGGELQITYRAKINENASVGTQQLGSAQLNWGKAGERRNVYVSNKAAVSTGGFHIRLTDREGAPLSGGEFMVARMAAPEEQKDPPQTLELLDTGEDTIAVVYESFCPSEDLSTRTSYTVKTDQNGNAVCYGLSYGTYYLVQTQPARKEDLPAAPIMVTVSEVSHLTSNDGWTDSDGQIADNTVYVVNGAFSIPQTGGPGVYGITVAGGMVVISACLLLWYNRKRKILC